MSNLNHDVTLTPQPNMMSNNHTSPTQDHPPNDNSSSEIKVPNPTSPQSSDEQENLKKLHHHPPTGKSDDHHHHHHHHHATINEKIVPGIKKNAFVHKLYIMLSDEKLSNLIWWNEDNELKNTFSLLPGKEFSKLLTNYFKHGNVASFVRQLHMYGFHKVNDTSQSYQNNATSNSTTNDQQVWEFKHSSGRFKKDDEEGLIYIKRRSSSNSNKSSNPSHTNHASSQHPITQPSQHQSSSHLPSSHSNQHQHLQHHQHQLQHQHQSQQQFQPQIQHVVQPPSNPSGPDNGYYPMYYYNDYMVPINYVPYQVYPPGNTVNQPSPVPGQISGPLPHLSQLPPQVQGQLPSHIPGQLPPQIQGQMIGMPVSQHLPNVMGQMLPMGHHGQSLLSNPNGSPSSNTSTPKSSNPVPTSIPTANPTSNPTINQAPIPSTSSIPTSILLSNDLNIKEPIPQRPNTSSTNSPTVSQSQWNHRLSNTSPTTIINRPVNISPQPNNIPNNNVNNSGNIQNYNPLQFRKIWNNSYEGRPRNPSLLYDPLAPIPRSSSTISKDGVKDLNNIKEKVGEKGERGETTHVPMAGPMAPNGNNHPPPVLNNFQLRSHSQTQFPRSLPSSLPNNQQGSHTLPNSLPGSISGGHGNNATNNGAINENIRPSLVELYKGHDSILTNNSIFSHISSISSIGSNRDNSIISVESNSPNLNQQNNSSISKFSISNSTNGSISGISNNLIGNSMISIKLLTPPPRSISIKDSPIIRSQSSTGARSSSKVSIHSLLDGDGNEDKRRKLSES